LNILSGKVILLTGGTGSFGQAFVTEALKHNPKAIRIFSRSEYLHVEMMRRYSDERLRYFIGDIRDKERLDAIMRDVDYVIHAAALKHVLLGERNPQEFIKTNVLGSLNILESAIGRGVEKVIGISSDKAVNPISSYGMSKALMERLFCDANLFSAPKTLLSCIRSGNFWDSSGSVIPLWREQSKKGVITLTDVEMSRYWIELPAIARFTINCLWDMKGGEIIIPKMDERRLIDIAHDMFPDCEVVVTGKSNIERVQEQLFAEHETPEDCGNYWTVK